MTTKSGQKQFKRVVILTALGLLGLSIGIARFCSKSETDMAKAPAPPAAPQTEARVMPGLPSSLAPDQSSEITEITIEPALDFPAGQVKADAKSKKHSNASARTKRFENSKSKVANRIPFPPPLAGAGLSSGPDGVVEMWSGTNKKMVSVPHSLVREHEAETSSHSRIESFY